MKSLCCRQAGLASEKFCYKAMMLTYACSTFSFVLLKYRRPYLKKISYTWYLYSHFHRYYFTSIKDSCFLSLRSCLLWLITRQMVPLLLSPEKAAPKFSKKIVWNFDLPNCVHRQWFWSSCSYLRGGLTPVFDAVPSESLKIMGICHVPEFEPY